jgi:TRAP-type C4-dicarboxylate transport system substrate-binding protein
VNETSHAFTFDYAAISKPWFDTLPADLQAMGLATAEEIGTRVNPLEIDSLARQRKIWVEQGGEIDVLSPADKDEIMRSSSRFGTCSAPRRSAACRSLQVRIILTSANLNHLRGRV